MAEINYAAAVVAAVAAAFVTSIIWYSIFGETLAQVRTESGNSVTNTPVWKMPIEIARSLVLVLVLAYFVSQLHIENWTEAMPLAILVWVGFPVVVLGGSVLWENVPWKLAAIHAGDWLVKLVLVTVILGLWR